MFCFSIIRLKFAIPNYSITLTCGQRLTSASAPVIQSSYSYQQYCTTGELFCETGAGQPICNGEEDSFCLWQWGASLVSGMFRAIRRRSSPHWYTAAQYCMQFCVFAAGARTQTVSEHAFISWQVCIVRGSPATPLLLLHANILQTFRLIGWSNTCERLWFKGFSIDH